MKRSIGAACIFVVIVIGSAWAHHGMSAIFDFDQRFTRTGTLERLDWRNPHIYLFVEARKDKEQLETWAFEGPSPVFFRTNKKVGKADFERAVGQTITVEASRARDGSLSGLIRQVTLTDGTVVSLCPENC
jgi:hypothetical protein